MIQISYLLASSLISSVTLTFQTATRKSVQIIIPTNNIAVNPVFIDHEVCSGRH